jgi:hypothetical protein
MNLLDESDDELRPTSASLRVQLISILEHDSYSRLLAELSVPRSPLQRLLLRHPDDLFPKLDPEDAIIPKEFSISLPVLHWDSSQESSDDSPSRPTILDYYDGETPEVDESEEVVGAEDESEDLSDMGSFEEILLLNALRVLQCNPHLLRLVRKQDAVTLPQVRKALGTRGLDLRPVEDEALTLMGNIAEQEGLGKVFRTLFRRSATDTESIYEMKKMVSEAYEHVRDLLMDVPRLVGELHRFLPVIAQKGAPFLQRHNAFVRWVYGTTSSEHLQAINRLWELNLLHPAVITLACRSCKDDEGQPICQVLSSDMPPGDLGMKPVCSWCGGPVLIQAFYGLDGWVHRWIASQDRLLAYVVAYSLETLGIMWQSHVQTPTSEHDFHLTTSSGNHLIECKVFRCSTPIRNDRGLQRKVRTAISQLITHSAEMQVASATLVCHPCPFTKKTTNQWIALEKERKNLPETAAKVQVIGIDGLPEFLEGIT